MQYACNHLCYMHADAQARREEQQSRRRTHITVEAEHDSDSEGDAPYFSLISGGYKPVPNLLPRVSTIDSHNTTDHNSTDGDATQQASAGGVLSKFVSPAADFLQSREYKGLEM